jgi:tRNA threonylcarbamoyladenosine biosynthesis protein TsaB
MGENRLVIDTGGKVGRVGLVVDGAVVRAVNLDSARRHARDLTVVIGDVLAGAGLRAADLSGVTVAVGPGSFTGLRVGVMAAKSLAYATGCDLVPVPTFHAIARQAPAEAADLWVIADALQGQVYLQRFARGAPVDELRIVAAAEALPVAPAEAWLTGPGVAVYAVKHIPQHCNLVDEAAREARVESLYAAGLSVAPLTRPEVFALEPLYLRGSSAEEAAKKRAAPA